MEFFAIGDRETVLGLRLTGVDGCVVNDRISAHEALEAAVKRMGIGVVLITEKIAALIRDEVDERTYGAGFPLVLEIPDGSGPAATRLKLEDAVRKAIGISI